MDKSATSTYLAKRPMVLGLAKVVFLAIAQLPIIRAAPLHASSFLFAAKEDGEKPAANPSLWLYLGVAAALVLLGGAFAGLTIALMGQDEIYLQVIKTSGEGAERKHAAKVLALLNRGKHWVLVTLLLSNVITNETLPIVLDRSLGGGWPAVLGSTVLIVIFGEIAPQSVCVRYGLPIGSWMAPFVLGLMYILAPVAWPTAKLLDWLLGEDHGTVYKKAGLKTLVSLHRTLGDSGQQLNSDEVTIISAVLDLKDKPVGSIMTPMDKVFTLSADDVLDEETMDILLSQGYSRIPVHHPDNDENFVGMLLVKMLITYDPEDAKPVRDFALATLPETLADTSCLDIVNFFQEGKSHMVLVSDHPGEDYGAIGVVTLEDVIEELIGEEIIDESDVFIDVQKAIRRLAPAPRTKVPKGQVVELETAVTKGTEGDLIDIAENEALAPDNLQRSKTTESTAPKSKGSEDPSSSPRHISYLGRRRSSATGSNAGDLKAPKRSNTAEMREHLKHLGPSNLASRPKTTRYNTVKIKPGLGSEPLSKQVTATDRKPLIRRISESSPAFYGSIGEGLIASGGLPASDGVQALLGDSPIKRRPTSSASKGFEAEPSGGDTTNGSQDVSRGRSPTPASRRSSASGSTSTVGSLRNDTNGSRSQHRVSKGPARSGSITENIIDANGIRKVVLGTTSSSSNEEDENSGAREGADRQENEKPSNQGGAVNGSGGARLRGGGEEEDAENASSGAAKKKKRRRRKQGHRKGEEEPLLGEDR